LAPIWKGLQEYYSVVLKRWVSLVVVVTGIPGVLGSFGLPVGLPNWGWGLIALGVLAVIQYQGWHKAMDRAAVADKQNRWRAMGATSGGSARVSVRQEMDPANGRNLIKFQSGEGRRVEATGGRPRSVQFIKPMIGPVNLSSLPAHVAFPDGELVVHAITDEGIDVEPFGRMDVELIAEVFVEAR
jgi:hypothetical protein